MPSIIGSFTASVIPFSHFNSLTTTCGKRNPSVKLNTFGMVVRAPTQGRAPYWRWSGRCSCSWLLLGTRPDGDESDLVDVPVQTLVYIGVRFHHGLQVDSDCLRVHLECCGDQREGEKSLEVAITLALTEDYVTRNGADHHIIQYKNVLHFRSENCYLSITSVSLF